MIDGAGKGMAAVARTRADDWYRDWQHEEHAVRFDWRARLDARNLVREYESSSDVQLLIQHLDRARTQTLVELGCATGELYRYLNARYPAVRYLGVDISEAAIRRAQAKYPHGAFVLSQPGAFIQDTLQSAGLHEAPHCLYARDVIFHQPDPFGFLAEVLQNASEAVIVRLRTRDVGPTERDPERSCQFHYNGWMPYIVMSIEETIAGIHQAVPGAEIVVYRHHMILGGQHNRFLPKDCYVKETGTAETAMGIWLRTGAPGTVTIEDRRDGFPRYTIDYRMRHLASQCVRSLRSGSAFCDTRPRAR